MLHGLGQGITVSKAQIPKDERTKKLLKRPMYTHALLFSRPIVLEIEPTPCCTFS